MIPLFKPYMPDDISGITDILYSGELSYGKWGKAFEEKLCEYIGIPNILTINTYSNAIIIALLTLGIKAEDEVIASPMACLQSNLPLATYGLKVVWADIDPKTGTLDPSSVEKKITSKTKAIIHNHYCGYPGYVDEINKIGKRKEIFVIDDCIEAFGSQYKDRKMGNLGTDVTLFSFQTVRFPNTIEGGAIVFKDKSLFQKAILCRDLGIDRPHFRDQNGEISTQCDISSLGIAAMTPEINSYLGCIQMKNIDIVLNKQKANAFQWQKYFEQSSILVTEMNKRVDILPNYWVYGILTPNKLQMMSQFRNLGYYTSGIHSNNNYYSVFGEREELFGVNEFMSNFLALPCGWWVNL